MLRRIGLWLAGLEEVPPADAQEGLQGYLAGVVHPGASPITIGPGEEFVGRIRVEGAREIRCIIGEKNEWRLMRRRV